MLLRGAVPAAPSTMAEKPFDIKKTVTRLKTVGGAVMHVTAAAPRRDKLVRCVLKYRKKGAEEA